MSLARQSLIQDELWWDKKAWKTTCYVIRIPGVVEGGGARKSLLFIQEEAMTLSEGVYITVLALLSLVCTGLAAQEGADPAVSLTLDLVDGSRVIGVPRIESIPVQTQYATMDIPLKHIASIKMEDDNENAFINLQNGDSLKGVLNLKPLELETIFGDVSVALEHVDTVVVNDGRAVWISKNATYTASSVYAGQSPLPSLLTGEGKLYIYTDGSQYAFHTEIQDNPSITIDLGDTKTVERIYIKNRKGYGHRSKGITAWVSSDRAIRGEQVGVSDELLDDYTMPLPIPQRARFITLGLQRRDYFHLQHVKIFGQE